MDFKVSQRRHIQHAALLWVCIGLLLCGCGLNWLFTDAVTSPLLVILLPIAVILGVLKGIFILRKSASWVVMRIQRFGEQTPFWHLFNLSTYLLIMGMMAFGFGCRWAGNYWNFMGYIGMLYFVVGVALIIGSSRYWSNAGSTSGKAVAPDRLAESE